MLRVQVTYIGVARASHIYWWCKCKSHISVLQVQVTDLSLPSASCVYIYQHCKWRQFFKLHPIHGILLQPIKKFDWFCCSFYFISSTCLCLYLCVHPGLVLHLSFRLFIISLCVFVLLLLCAWGGWVGVCVGGGGGGVTFQASSGFWKFEENDLFSRPWKLVINSCYQCLWKSVNFDLSCQTERQQTPDWE